jgi:hypothetical protein
MKEDCTWSGQPRLNRDLLHDLRGQFGGNITREILLAAAGVKLSRTCLSDSKLELLRAIAQRHNISISASSERYIHRGDVGKGGSSNSVERIAEPDEADGLRNVYIAADPMLAMTGQMLEEAGDEDNFGILLGIPECCRNAYSRLSAIASSKQNDFVLLTLDNTGGPMPYDPWVNYPANYFGPGLISFFPCSFRCERAAFAARSTFEMLSACDETWARSFVKLQQTNILYTEYDGLHLFRRPLVGGWIEYSHLDYTFTESSRVSNLIASGSRLEVLSKHKVLIYSGSEQLGSITGVDVGMCAFY